MPEVVLLQQPRGQIAEELAEQLPGLMQLKGSGDNATVVVGDVRKHDKLLEKVRLGSAETWDNGLQDKMRLGSFWHLFCRSRPQSWDDAFVPHFCSHGS